MHIRLVAPAGTPITFGELIKTVFNLFKRGPQTTRLSTKIENFTNSRHNYFLNSGRSAQALLLKSMYEIAGTERNEVILPAYTCHSVAAATVRAGLKIRLVDIDPSSLDFDFEQLGNADGGRVLAIIGCNLFGVLNDWDKLNQIGAASHSFLIDDGAQSFGAQCKGRASGMMGTAGFYSLGRGKALTTYSGGILVTNHDELALQIDRKVSDLPSTSLFSEPILLAKLMAYSMFIRPRLYWIPASLPFLGLGETIYDVDFDMSKLSVVQTVTGVVLVDSILHFHSMRAANSLELANAVLELGKYEVPGWDPAHCPPYLRLPVLAPDPSSRDLAIKELRKAGVVATRMYPSTLNQIPGIDNHLTSVESRFPGAQQLVDRLFTLPTHPFLTDKDFDNILTCLRKI